jgi:type I restriction enzyme, S subunit
MSELVPEGWELKTLDELCTKITDGEHLKPNVISEGIPFVSAKDLKENGVDFSRVLYVNKHDAEIFRKKCNPEKNDILIGSRGSIGKICIVNTDQIFCLLGSVILLKLIPSIQSEFMKYFLQSSESQNKILNASGHSVVKAVYLKDIKKLQIPIPPIELQKKIIKKLDDILRKLEKKKKELSNYRNIEKTKKILVHNKNQLFNSALNGVLSENWRLKHEKNIESPSLFLEKILNERQKKWEILKSNKFKEANNIPKNSKWKDSYKLPLQPVGILPKLPKSWSWITLDQITWLVRDGPHYSPEYSDGGIPFITGGNVRPDGIDFKNSKRITPELHTELSKRCKPEKNDILYTKGGTTGIARVNTYEIDFNVWVHVAVLKLVDSVHPFYVQHALNSPWCYAQSQKLTHGVGNKDLGLTRMISITLPLPSLSEQQEISKILMKKLSELELIQSKVFDVIQKKEKSEKYIQNMTSSILNSAFTGKLVN